MKVQVSRDSATASAGSDAHSQNPASVESMRGSRMRGRHRGATELVRKSRNVSRTRVATLNVGTLTDRSCELVEALERRRVVFCAVQEDGGPLGRETRWSSTGCSCELVEALERRRVDFCAVQETRWACRRSRDIGRGFKAVLVEVPGPPVIIVAAKERLYHFFSAYSPKTGCSEQAKDEFWSLHNKKTAERRRGFGYGSRSADGERILDCAESLNLTIVNTVFRKRGSHLIYYSGGTKTQTTLSL
ncbi:unnamed protein product [Heligmosomoides polygyrus]|uniref:Endo/exonuclease/phosphatase domain-containing protein n=1 Tax=Heligmosomoides polygyrus TaxID=6339 RepID=A0A183FT26_HELPZ|nr:unnamed protein product [Heligmosomoides polygyrus]